MDLLVAFGKTSVDDGIVDSWDTSADVCMSWGGVGCDRDGGTVEFLDISFSGIGGDIVMISTITSLVYIDASFSLVTGKVDSLAPMVNLVYFTAEGTALSGDVSMLFPLVELTVLNLMQTNVHGDMAALAGLSKLGNGCDAVSEYLLAHNDVVLDNLESGQYESVKAAANFLNLNNTVCTVDYYDALSQDQQCMLYERYLCLMYPRWGTTVLVPTSSSANGCKNCAEHPRLGPDGNPVGVTWPAVLPAHKESLLAFQDSQPAIVDNIDSLKGGGWGPKSDPCSDFWYGVSCKQDGSVETLVFYSTQHLGGDIATLNLLGSLSKIDLHSTKVGGDVIVLSTMLELVDIDFHFTDVTGDLAGLSSLVKLTYVDFHGTQVYGGLNVLTGLVSLLELDTSYTAVTGDFDPDAYPLLQFRNRKVVKPEQKQVLMDFKHSGGAANTNLLSSWDIGTDPCRDNWRALSCNGEGDVTDMLLADLDGTVSGDIGLLAPLAGMANVDMSYQDVTGDINAFSSMPELTSLIMSQCSVTGSLEVLGNSVNLNDLEISGTQIVGNVVALSGLSKILFLEIQDCPGIYGDPTVLVQLPNMDGFSLNYDDCSTFDESACSCGSRPPSRPAQGNFEWHDIVAVGSTESACCCSGHGDCPATSPGPSSPASPPPPPQCDCRNGFEGNNCAGDTNSLPGAKECGDFMSFQGRLSEIEHSCCMAKGAYQHRCHRW